MASRGSSSSATAMPPLPRAAIVSADSASALSRANTAAYDESDGNWVTTSENAPTTCTNAMEACGMTPNSTVPRMKSGPTMSTGIIWIR